MDNKIFAFIRKKEYDFVKEIGQGGLGRTVLLHDKIIDTSFVCKKYSPVEGVDKNLYFKNFVDEIKLLHLMYHHNVVRVFNYFLYPEETTGYIFMEYVNGKDVMQFIKERPDKAADVFRQVISGFNYLQQINVLHRDIRPQNILVSNEGTVKIIDFGFGKKINFDVDFGKSITLNWWYSAPDEFAQKTYDFKTEIYFIGRLFEEALQENRVENFPFVGLLKSMTAPYTARIASFFDVTRGMLEQTGTENPFSSDQRAAYRGFADSLCSIMGEIGTDAEYVSDLNAVESKLESIYQSSLLEEYVQSNSSLVKIFIKGAVSFRSQPTMPVDTLRSFYQLFRGSSNDKQRILLNHFWHRFDSFDRFDPNAITTLEDLPF